MAIHRKTTRREVDLPAQMPRSDAAALLRQVVAIAAIARRLQNGVGVRTVLEHYVTPVDFVGSISSLTFYVLTCCSDYAKLTRKVGQKNAVGSSNLRPKGPPSPTS